MYCGRCTKNAEKQTGAGLPAPVFISFGVTALPFQNPNSSLAAVKARRAANTKVPTGKRKNATR